MNDSQLGTLLRELAEDVPDRSDDEAVEALRRAVGRRSRGRSVKVGAAVAAAAAVVAVVAWAVSPVSDDETPVASTDGDADPPAFDVDVTADVGTFTGVLPPLVVVSVEGTTVTLIDPLSREGVVEYATVTTTNPVEAASVGPQGQSILLTVRTGQSPFVVEVDLVSGEIGRRWDAAAGMQTAPGHERVAYLQPAHADGGQGVVIEDLGTGAREVFNTPAAGPGIDGWLSWSSDGRLAVGGADGTVRILDPDTAVSFDDAGPAMGPLFNADWAGPDDLIGTRDCCEPSQVVVADVSTGSLEQTELTALDIAAIDSGGSPWGNFYIDSSGRLQATGTDPDVEILQVGQLEW